MTRLSLAPAALLALTSAAASAQSTRVTRTETNAWLDATTDVWLAPRMGLQGELLYERSDAGREPMQIEARLGVQRMLRSGARLALGGTFIHNSPYGPFPAKAPLHELRAWQQATIDQRLGVVSLTHRYRLEERWVQRPGAGADGEADVAYSLRSRYQLRATVPLTRAAHPLYAAASDELFVVFGPHAPLNLLDQNRASAGVGVRWSPALRTEIGYLDQVLLRSNGTQIEHNHTLQLGLNVTRPAPKR